MGERVPLGPARLNVSNALPSQYERRLSGSCKRTARRALSPQARQYFFVRLRTSRRYAVWSAVSTRLRWKVPSRRM